MYLISTVYIELWSLLILMIFICTFILFLLVNLVMFVYPSYFCPKKWLFSLWIFSTAPSCSIFINFTSSFAVPLFYFLWVYSVFLNFEVEYLAYNVYLFNVWVILISFFLNSFFLTCFDYWFLVLCGLLKIYWLMLYGLVCDRFS